VSKVNSTLDEMLGIVMKQDKDVINFRNLLVDVDTLVSQYDQASNKEHVLTSSKTMDLENQKWAEKMRHIFRYKGLFDNW
jgi:hypothetical protein